MSIGKTDIRKVKKLKKKIEESRPKLKWRILKGGDVELNYEWLKEWAGSNASDMAVDHDGRKTLRWICSKDFPTELTDALERVLEEYH